MSYPPEMPGVDEADILAYHDGYLPGADGNSLEVKLDFQLPVDEVVAVHGYGMGQPYSWTKLFQDDRLIVMTLLPFQEHGVYGIADMKAGVCTTFKLVLERPLRPVHPSVGLPGLWVCKYDPTKA